MDEHPFAPYIRALGKGRNGWRALSESEAQDAMRMILSGEAQPIQVGALLMLMRVKEETPAEIAGFVRAVQQSIPLPVNLPPVRLDWSSYAGKRRQLPWFVLSALMLAANGIPSFMHGTTGYDPTRLFVPAVLQALGVRQARSLEEAAQQIAGHGFAFAPLSAISSVLDELMLLRPVMGLRSPVHTVARMLNPLRAEAVMQGIFHPGYGDIHQEAAALLGLRRAAVMKGEGGEAERNPDVPCLVKTMIDGIASDLEWPALFAMRHLKDETNGYSPSRCGVARRRVRRIWRGCSDRYRSDRLAYPR